MASKIAPLTQENIYEWICSTGYLLPTNEKELARFERLHAANEVIVNPEAIDPLAIIRGTRKAQKLSLNNPSLSGSDVEELRMAARKHGGLPPDIEEQIRKNQQKKQDGRE
jgi:hypothetical protein